MEKHTSERISDRLKYYFDDEEMVLLESQLHGHPSSQKSYVAVKPRRTIRAYGNKIILEENGVKNEYEMDPWRALEQFQNSKKSWLFGYIGYDLKNFLENLQSKNPELVRTPDLYFIEPSSLYSVKDGTIQTLVGEKLSVKNLPVQTSTEVTTGNISPTIQKDDYITQIKRIQERIVEGDFYEMNYSYPMMGTYHGDSFQLYNEMRKINPVPFGGYIQGMDFTVCCSSPERFLCKDGDLIRSEPIKGTAPRSGSVLEDNEHRQLLLNEKNRAENLMIVDLVRHDLSRIAKPGSVRVTKLFDIQTFGTVHQLISTVEALAEKGRSPIEIIKACFPMGSMTGAPKIEVMHAIDEIEMYRRGIYSGAMGYFTPDGNFDFNVIIRTAILQDQKLIYPVGGAITSDSDPQNEWEETEIKARNLTQVLNQNLVKKTK